MGGKVIKSNAKHEDIPEEVMFTKNFALRKLSGIYYTLKV